MIGVDDLPDDVVVAAGQNRPAGEPATSRSAIGTWPDSSGNIYASC